MKLFKPLIAAGALFKCSKTNRCFFLLRGENESYANKWALVGGKINHNENVINGLYREIKEEIGFIPKIEKWIYFNQYTSLDKKFVYHSILMLTPDEFIPKLNNESNGFSWIPLDVKIGPMHPRLKELFTTKILVDSIRDFK